MLIGLLAIVISAASLTNPVYAHFIVEDDKTGVKALFHITPDHDPIAGQESVISFDFAKTEFQTKDFSYMLTVKSTKGEAVTVPIEVTSNVILATYTFPSQGFYNVRLVATNTNDGTVSKLQYGQRVSRGVRVEQDKALGSFEIGVIGTVAVIAIGGIIFGVVSDSNTRKGKRDETKNRE